MRYIFPLACLVILWSCEESIGIAPDGVLEDDYNIAVTDTFTVFSYTQLEDSLITSSPNYLLTGTNVFEKSGRVNAEAYLNLRPSGTLGIDETDDVYDSLYLFLFFNELLSGVDEDREYTVHLIEPVGTEEIETSYYNFDRLPYDDTPIGKFTYSPHLQTGDSVAIKIQTGLGEELFSWAQEEIVSIGNSEFINRFTGVVIKPVDGSDDQIISLINNMSTTSSGSRVNKLRLYYHEDGDYVESKIFDFYNTQYNATFNSISTEFDGSYLEGLEETEELPSSETGELSFLQAGIGVYSRITFPYLHKINELGNKYIINSAILIIEPETEAYSYGNPLPDSLAIFLTNNLNEAGEFNYNTTAIQEYLQYATLSYDYELGGKAQYKFDITDLVNIQIEDNGFLEYSVLLTPSFSNMKTCFEEVEIPNKNHVSAGISLKMYVLKY